MAANINNPRGVHILDMWSEEEEGVIEMTMNDHEGGGGFLGMNIRLRGLRYILR